MSSMQESYKAIADPTRRRILKYLRGGERTAGELAEDAGVGRTALSHHLMVLKLADLVRVERRGQFQVYSLNTTVFQDLLTEIVGWLGGMEMRILRMLTVLTALTAMTVLIQSAQLVQGNQPLSPPFDQRGN